MSTSLPDLGSSGVRSKSSALCPRFALALVLFWEGRWKFQHCHWHWREKSHGFRFKISAFPVLVIHAQVPTLSSFVCVASRSF